VFSFFKNGIPLGFSDPILWLTQRFSCLIDSILTVYVFLNPFGLLPLTGGIFVIAFAVIGFIYNRSNKAVFMLISISLLWLAMNIATITLAQNLRPRYFCTSSLLILLSATTGIIYLLEKRLPESETIPSKPFSSFFPHVFACIVFFGVFFLEFPQIQYDGFHAEFTKINSEENDTGENMRKEGRKGLAGYSF